MYETAESRDWNLESKPLHSFANTLVLTAFVLTTLTAYASIANVSFIVAVQMKSWRPESLGGSFGEIHLHSDFSALSW